MTTVPSRRKVQFSYTGSRFWLIFWMVLFLPVGMILLATGLRFEVDQKVYHLFYDGSRGWLAFWFVMFFPIAVALAFANGFSLEISDSAHTDVSPTLP